jgi:hypothetical protein
MPAATHEFASPSSTASASPSPASAPTSIAAVLAIDELGEVVVSDLVVRSAPGVDPGSSSILPGRLTTADRFFVVAGPVAADGYAWYQVAPLTRSDGSAGPFGWVASGSRDGDPWVVMTAAACPPTVSLEAILELQPLERLACFGDDPIGLVAPTVSCGAGGGPYTWEPAWLVMVGGCGLALSTSSEQVLIMRTPPAFSGSVPPSGPVGVTGHFDDAAARGCTVTTSDPVGYPPPGPAQAVVICRTEFVLDSVP